MKKETREYIIKIKIKGNALEEDIKDYLTYVTGFSIGGSHYSRGEYIIKTLKTVKRIK